MKNDPSHVDIYQKVTDQIIAAIEKGAGRWEMPWNQNSGMPLNVQSGKFYRGVNVPVLWATAQAKGYEDPIWGTYKQWQEKDAQVKKGEKSAMVVFWKFFDNAKGDETEAEPDDKSGRRAMARAYPVFNCSQVDGYTPIRPEPLPIAQRIDNAEEFFRQVGADVRHGGPKAFYSPSTDHIQMPPWEAFKDAEAYYATSGHEHGHWTGGEKRLARDLKGRFGSDAYAMEELAAEMAAAFLCADLGLAVNPRPEHAAYIDSWLRVLRGDKRAIFTAAGQAQRSTDYLHSLQPQQEKEAPEGVLRAMEDGEGPLPDAVAAAWADDLEPRQRSFAQRQAARRASNSKTEIS
jgi:antirestriction protein ArdC